MSRIARNSGGKKGKSIPATALASLLIGLFVILGMSPLLNTLALLLPSYEVPVKIVGRDQHESFYASPRGTQGDRLSYRMIVQFEDGTRRALACREDLYRKSVAGLRNLDTVRLRSSVLAGRPISLSITSKPLFTTPLLRVEPSSESEVHPLVMPVSGILITALFCWGIAIYLMVKLRNNPILVNKVHYPILGSCAVVGLVWWSSSV